MLAHAVELARGLRAAGVSVGTSEIADGLEALATAETLDRPMVAALLKAAMIKEQRHFDAFDNLFNQIFFNKGIMTHNHPSLNLRQRLAEIEASQEQDALFQQLARELTIEFMEKKNKQWMTNMKWVDMITKRIEDSSGFGNLPGTGGGNLSGQGTGDKLVAAIRQQVAGYQYNRQADQELYELEDNALRYTPFAQTSFDDVKAMEQLIAKMAKKIATRNAGARLANTQGKINFRKLWRKSLSSGGIPLDLSWEKPPKRKSRLFVLLDTSRSMMRTVTFFLQVMFALAGQFSDIRAFVFVSHLREISHLIERDSISTSVDHIISRSTAGHEGLTDYGGVLGEFCAENLEAVTKKATVVILGDARNNRFLPQPEHLLEIKRRCAHLIWLNPEGRWAWGTGDSVMNIYEPFCTAAYECRSLAQMEVFVEDLLEIQH